MRVDARGQGDVLGGVGSLGGLDRGADQLVRAACNQMQVELAFLSAGDGVEVVDQPAQPGGLGLEHLQGLLVAGHDPVGDALQVAVDGGQGVAQLVDEGLSRAMRRASSKLTPNAVATATPVPVASATSIALERPSSRWRATSGETGPSAMRTWVWNTPGATARATTAKVRLQATTTSI